MSSYLESEEEEGGQDNWRVSRCCYQGESLSPSSIGMVRTDYEYGNIALLHGIADRTIIPVLKEIYPTM
ncbi:MAG: hypothetical protein AMDU5_GPLC00017G0087 [Thermoplasmatales archaeon Gpl]|nr:MAG: hypothetical protein AMDU5_GPLC00017G0087 [Thermoplasmatales archaeon Gpl]